MSLKIFYDYKNRIMEDLLTDERILNLLNDQELEEIEPGDFVYTQVFPYEYLPDTVEHAKTFICCDVDINRVMDSTYMRPVIYLWVFTHKSKLRLPEGGVRTDELAAAIDDKINGSRFYGLGELELYSSKRFAPISDYQGKMLTYQAKEYNRLNPNRKPIPTVRGAE